MPKAKNRGASVRCACGQDGWPDAVMTAGNRVLVIT